jgi:hypothetical protein
MMYELTTGLNGFPNGIRGLVQAFDGSATGNLAFAARFQGTQPADAGSEFTVRESNTEKGQGMKFRVIALAVTLGLSAIAFGQEFRNAELFKGATAEKKKGDSVKGTLAFDKEKKEIRFLTGKGTPELTIGHEAIKSMTYERAAKPRYAEGILIAWPLLFTKSKKHYLTIQYSEPSGAGQYAIMRLDKNNYRDILATAEAQTGKRVDRSEER